MLCYAIFVNWLNRYEREPKLLVGAVFLWGAIVAAGIAFSINSFIGARIYHITGSLHASQITTGSLVAPVVEESLKGIGVLVVMLVFSRHFNSVLDGLIYAGIAALGFAATENIYYIYNYGYLENGFRGVVYLAFVRDIIVGWQHPFFTAFTGIGISAARLTRSLSTRLAAPVLGWIAAVLIHSLHNTLANLFTGNGWVVAGSLLDWGGYLAMFAFIVWALQHEQTWVKKHLTDELLSGILSRDQYQVAVSIFKQSLVRYKAALTGSYSATDRFYALCGKLAHQKQLIQIFGERETAPALAEIRAEMAALQPEVYVDPDTLPIPRASLEAYAAILRQVKIAPHDQTW